MIHIFVYRELPEEKSGMILRDFKLMRRIRKFYVSMKEIYLNSNYAASFDGLNALYGLPIVEHPGERRG